MIEIKRYDKFCELLLKYNRVHKVTGAKTKLGVLELVEDSLYPFDGLKDVKKVLDIGTGAGFPGLVLAISHPEVEFFLCEPLLKRSAFLNLVAVTYELKNVTIIPARVEDIEPFKVDVITSKAVSDAKTLINLSCAFIDAKTKLLLYKGKKAYHEAKGLSCKITSHKNSNYMIIKDIKC